MACRVTFEVLLLRVLDCLCRFPAQEINEESLASTRASYGVSIISNLWVYRAAYGLRHEYWLMQACFLAILALLPNLGKTPSLAKSMVMACQLLYSMGEFLPPANECLWIIRKLLDRHGLEVPKPCKNIFAGVAVRYGKTYLRDVLVVSLDKDGADHRRLSSVPQEVAFSDLIQSIRDLQADDSG